MSKMQTRCNKNGSRKSNDREGKGKLGKPISKQLNKSNSSKGQRRLKEEVDTEYKSERNDFAWYDKYHEFTAYAGTIPVGKPSGETFQLATPTSTIGGTKQVIPGICVINFYPVPGFSRDRNSPINRSAIRWYSALRRMQKASADYDSQDMMISYMAIDSAAMFHELGKRIVGIANRDSVLNRYIPEGLLYGMNVDPIDVRDNIADWRGYVNKFAIDIANVTMPKDMDIRVRHSWMCSGIYTDGEAERSQIYMFQPEGFWIYDNTVNTGSQLVFMDWPNHPNQELITLSKFKEMGNKIIASLLGDEDIATISGDVYNAIGAANCITYDQIADGYTVEALYSEMVLSQIENSTAVGYFAESYTPVISQNPSVNNGAILFQPKFTYQSAEDASVANKRLFLNFHIKGQPSVEETIEATRLRTMLLDSTQAGVIEPETFGSEIVSVYSLVSAKPDTPQVFDAQNIGTNIVFDGTNANYVMQACSKLASFDWAPIIYLFNGTGDQPLLIGPLVDFEVTTVLEAEKLADMHEAALMSVYAMPESYLK